jgi:hypothetical protein
MKPYSALVPAIGMEYLGAGGIMTQGQAWFVKPYSGNDGNSGKRPDRAVKTLAKALSLATADQNDTVYLMAESNTSANTTDYQSSQLDWNKDGVHLIGVNAGSFIGQRSRIAQISTWTSANPLFKLSADNCLIANLGLFSGVADATTLGCMTVTGTRNKIYNCQISGIGNAANDIADAYSLYLNGAAENIFERCYIGLDTIPRSTNTNSEIRVAGSATRNTFLDCTVVSQIGHATYHPYVYLSGATAIDRWLHFKRCTFLNFATNYGFTQAVVFLHSATPTAGVIWVETSSAMATNWSATGVKVYISNSVINTAYTGGTGYTA